jgi:hypothetical protein
MDIVRVALVRVGEPQAPAPERYMVHLVQVQGSHELELLGGYPVAEKDAGQVACDCSTVDHHLSTQGEPLYLGRRQRTWSAAQRRAITVRDGGHCRFPGCERRYVDVHHQLPWAEGGGTDISNGFLACSRHHGLLHSGFGVTGSPNGVLGFHRPDGSLIGTTVPPIRHQIAFGVEHVAA